MYRNYKGFVSIVYVALVDPNNKFLWIDVNSDGSSNDASDTFVTTLEHTVLTIWHHVPITCPVGKLLSKHLHLCNEFVCESDAIAWPSVATVY